jgi:hypothetical protein
MASDWQGRMRITGGRTNVWARQSYRLSDLDFTAANMSWSDNERAMIPDMAAAAAEMLEAAGAKNIEPWTVPDRTPSPTDACQSLVGGR